MASGPSWVVVSRLPPRRNRRKRPKPCLTTPRRAARRSRNQRSRLGESTYSLETTHHGGAARGLAEFKTHVPASARARFSPKARLGGASECPLWRRWSLPGALCALGGRSGVPFVPSVIVSGCPVCRRWSLPGAICAIGGRFRAPVVASLVASGRPLCRWWSLLDALCAVSGRFRAPFWRHNVTEATCNCAQM